MRLQNYKISVIIVAVMLLSACSSVGKYVLPTHQFDSAVIASNDVNPNGVGRPSPVTLYFFQLKGADTFNSADFFSLYNDPQKTLGADYIGMGKADVAPGARLEVSFNLSDDAKYIGVMAAYQQLPRAVWRVTIPMDSWGKEKVYLYVNQFAISASKVETMADKATSAGQSAASAAGSMSSGSSSSSSGSSSGGSSFISSITNSGSSSSSSSSSGSSSGSSTSSRIGSIVNSLAGSNNTSSGAASSSAPSTATSSSTSTAPSTSTSSNSSSNSNSSTNSYVQDYNNIKSAVQGNSSNG